MNFLYPDGTLFPSKMPNTQLIQDLYEMQVHVFNKSLHDSSGKLMPRHVRNTNANIYQDDILPYMELVGIKTSCTKIPNTNTHTHTR